MPRKLGLLVFLLSGCASAPQMVEVQKPVLVQGPTEYIPVPPKFFAECLRPAESRGSTNGELLMHDIAWTQYSLCLEAELAAIQSLKVPK